MISLDNDDEEDIPISSGHNLSAIFDDDQSTEHSKTSLIYKPKTNKKPENPKQPKSLATLVASPVDVYKLSNGKYSHLGKFGMALLGNDFTFLLVIYTNQQQKICSFVLSETFHFLCQANNYCTFYDDRKENWSVLFPDPEQRVAFCRNVAHSVFALRLQSTSSNLIVIQELSYCEPNRNPTNKILAKISASTFVSKQEVWLFRNKPFTLQLSDPLLDKICANLSGQQRLVLLSVDHAKDLSDLIGSIPTEKLWKIGLEIEFVQFVEDSKIVEEESVKSEESTLKSDFENRMSRMGAMPILPRAPKPRSSSVKSITDELSHSTVERQKNPKHLPGQENFSPESSAKLDLVLDQLSQLKNLIKDSKASSWLDSSSISMDTAILLSSVKKLVEENGQLKCELEQKKQEIVKLNETVLELINTKPSIKHQDSDEKDSEDYKVKVFELKDKIGDLKEENYRLSMQNLQLEKKILEIEKESHSSVDWAKKWKNLLKHSFNAIHSDFLEQVDSHQSVAEFKPAIGELLTKTLINVRRQFLNPILEDGNSSPGDRSTEFNDN